VSALAGHDASGVRDLNRQRSREHGVGLGGRSEYAKKILDWIEEIVLISEVRQVVFTRQFDVFCARYVRGHVAGPPDTRYPVAAAMHDQGWHVDRGQDRTHVNGHIHPPDRDRRAWAAAIPEKHDPPADEILI
jgi:hypothetical protein